VTLKIPKKPKAVENPEPVKIPKRSADPVIGGESPLSWRFSHRDIGGPFSWRDVALNELDKLITRLAEFEDKNSEGIRKTGSHRIACDMLSDAARERLNRINKNDLDELMSFRVDGSSRVWCICDGSIMKVLWWDPTHQVYPTPVDKEDRKKVRNRK